MIDADPAMSIYRAQQAYFLALSANNQIDDGSMQAAIRTYETVVSMEPFYAPYRANLATLYWNNREEWRAVEVMQEVVALTPTSWEFAYRTGGMADFLDDGEAVAVEYFQKALALQPDLWLMPLPYVMWDQKQNDLSPLAQAAVHLSEGNANAALEAWEAFDGELYPPLAREVVRMMIALQQNDRALAVEWLQQAENATALTAEQLAWQHLGRAKLAQFDGDTVLAAQEIEAAQTALREDRSLDEDLRGGQSIAYGQFLRQGIPRQLLRQVLYPKASPLLRFLLNTF